MSNSLIEGLFKGTYVSFRLFGTKDGCDLVAFVVAADFMDGDIRDISIRCINTGRIAGKVVRESSPYWKGMATSMPPGFFIVQAKLSEFAEFSIDPEGIVRTSADLHFEIIDRFCVPVAPRLESTWYATCRLPLPSAETIARTAGGIGKNAFLFGGGTWHARLERLVRQYCGRDPAALDAILDWGVGCGRIARHFLERAHQNIYGADVDARNIDWLHQNTDWKNAVQMDFDPPMPFEDKFFDVVYGHSVFTHLAYENQFKWLEELRRVLKPGGYAFVTVCAESGVYVTKLREMERDPKFAPHLLETGFYDIMSRKNGVDARREGYDRLVAHTRTFIKERWSKYLEIQRIFPCFIDHQDLVVLRRVD